MGCCNNGWGGRRLPVDHSVDHHPVLLRRLGRKQLRLRLQQQRLQQRLRLLNTRNRARVPAHPGPFCPADGAEGAVFYGKTPFLKKRSPSRQKLSLRFLEDGCMIMHVMQRGAARPKGGGRSRADTDGAFFKAEKTGRVLLCVGTVPRQVPFYFMLLGRERRRLDKPGKKGVPSPPDEKENKCDPKNAYREVEI